MHGLRPPEHSTTLEAAAYWQGVRQTLDLITGRAGDDLGLFAKNTIADLYMQAKR